MIEPIEIRRQRTFMDEYMPLILKGDKKTIVNVARSAIGVVVDDAGTITLAGLGVMDRKPVWWLGREAGIPEYAGKSEPVQLALLMRRDIQEFFFWDGKISSCLKDWQADKNSQPKRDALLEVGGYLSNAMHTAHQTALKLLRLP